LIVGIWLFLGLGRVLGLHVGFGKGKIMRG